jgi:hypothetical protein
MFSKEDSLRTNEGKYHSTTISFLFMLVFLTQIGDLSTVAAQSAALDSYYGRRNTLGVFLAYSPDSSHILLGEVRERRLLNLGVAFERQLVINHIMNWQYSAEFAPVAIESDPIQIIHYTIDSTTPPGSYSHIFIEPTLHACQPLSETITVPGAGTETIVATCGRRWTMGEAMSPAGFRWSFLPRNKIQPFVDGHGGFMYSTQPIPYIGSGSFNFSFDFGAGIEIYRSKARSMRIEYRYHHISNNDTASTNPGIDNGLIQFAWCFGLGR